MRPISCRIPGIGTFLFQDDSGTSAVMTRPPYTCLPSETQEQMKTEAYAAVLAVCGMMAPGDKVALLTTVLRASKTYRNRYGLRKALFGLRPVDLVGMETTASQRIDDDGADTQSISHPSDLVLCKPDTSCRNCVLSEERTAYDSEYPSPQQPQEAMYQSNGAMRHTTKGNKSSEGVKGNGPKREDNTGSMHLQGPSFQRDTISLWKRFAVRLTSFLPSASGSFWISIDKNQRRKRTSFRRASRSYRAKIFKVTYELIQAVVEKFCPGVGRLDLLDRLSEVHQSKLSHMERNQLDGYAHHHSDSFSVKAPRRDTPKSAGKKGRDVRGGIDEPMTEHPLSMEKKSSSSLAPLDGERIDRMRATQSSSMAVLASIIDSEATQQAADYQNPSHAFATAKSLPLSVPYVHAPSLEVLTSMAQYVSEQVMALRPKTAAVSVLPACKAGVVSGGGGGVQATAAGSVAYKVSEATALDGKEVKKGSVVSAITSSPVSGTATGRTAKLELDRTRSWSQAFPTSNRCPDIQDLQLLPQPPLREEKRHRPQNSPSPSPLSEDNTEQPLEPWQQLLQALQKQISSSVPQSDAWNMVSCHPSHLGVPRGFPAQRPAPPSWQTRSLPLLHVPPLSSDYTVKGVFRPPFVPVSEASSNEVSIRGPLLHTSASFHH